MPGLVMLELDGALVDTAPEIAEAASAALAERGLPAVKEAEVRAWVGHDARQLISKLSGEEPPDARLLRAFEWHYAAISGRRSAPDAGSLQALRELRRLGVATALVTNKETRFTAPLLHAHDLWQWFDAVICGDMVDRMKPDPLAVEHCLERFRIAPGRALLVGDSDIDRATARNAGVAILPTLGAALQAVARAIPA